MNTSSKNKRERDSKNFTYQNCKIKNEFEEKNKFRKNSLEIDEIEMEMN